MAVNLKGVLIPATTWTSRAGCSGHIPGASHRPCPHLAETRQRGQDSHHLRPLLLNREGYRMPLLLTLQPPRQGLRMLACRHRHGVHVPAANSILPPSKKQLLPHGAFPRKPPATVSSQTSPRSPQPRPEPWFLVTFRPSAPWGAGLWLRTQAHWAPIQAPLLASAASVQVLLCASVSPSAT